MNHNNSIDYERYGEYHVRYDFMHLTNEITKILNILNTRFKEINLLDIGCGDGAFIESISAYFKVNAYVSDIAGVRLVRTKEKLGDNVKEYFLDDICNSKLKSNYFQFVNSDQVIEHVPDDKRMIKEIKRILKKDGFFRVSSIYKKRWAWYFYRCNGKWVLDPTHLREYSSINQFKNLFLMNGLKILELQTKNTNYPIIDFFLRTLNIKKTNKIINIFRRIKILIPGYYNIVIIGEK